jgi:hypothetical protein
MWRVRLRLMWGLSRGLMWGLSRGLMWGLKWRLDSNFLLSKRPLRTSQPLQGAISPHLLAEWVTMWDESDTVLGNTR